MASNLKVRVEKEMARLENAITALREDLKLHERVYRLLTGGAGPQTPARRTPAKRPKRTRAAKPVDWNSVLKGLPKTFTNDAVGRMKAAKGMSKAYLRRIVSRWAKEGKTKRIAHGRYQKT